MNRLFVIVAVGLILAVGFGCGSNEGPVNDGRLSIVATTGMVGDAVKEIAGDRVDLTVMMGPGVDPHLYKATKGDVDAINDADMIFYNGLYLEAKLTDIFEKMSGQKTVVAIGEAIDSSLLRFPAGAEGHPDPHVWFDLTLWQTAVGKVAEALAEQDAANAEYYRANAQAYFDTLSALDEWVQEQINRIPEQQRVLVTAHDAFEYFGRQYGIEVRGLQGISTVTEAGLQDITAMVDFLTDQKIKAVFVESSVPRKTIEAVVEGCRSRGHEVVVGGELFSDAMGEGGTPEGTFVGMVRHNVNTIVESLR
ncbi:manganese transporter [candidate division GN15 bacterium]|nr:manganese transporter [candidate division GN15 bacterium]